MRSLEIKIKVSYTVNTVKSIEEQHWKYLNKDLLHQQKTRPEKVKKENPPSLYHSITC